MTAHSGTEAANSPAPVSVDEKAADFENYLFGDEEEQENETPSEEGAEEGADLDLEEEQADESDEPETAIDAPVSLNAEEKAVFAQLPPEAQEAWAASETRRNAQVQEATTKASHAQREAETRAAQADAEAKARFAVQVEKIAQAYAPVEPVRAQYRDDVSYLTACREYDRQLAQHNDLVQQARGIQGEANTEAHAAFLAQRERELLAIPDIANPETRDAYFAKAFAIADALGYDRNELTQTMTAQDVKNLAEIAGWKEKAAKYEAAIASKMQKVRASKGKSLRPNAAPQGKTRAANADNAWQRVKASGKSREAQGEAMADWLEAQGIL